MSEIYEFGPFRVDPVERLVWCGDNRVPVKGKPFDVLLHLLQGGGQALAKEALIGRVWPNAAVEDSNLTVAVSQLRRALRDAGADREYVETLPGRGYRFLTHGRPIRPRTNRESTTPPGPLALSTEDRRIRECRALFVGRQPEFATLHRSFEEAREGAHRVILISGEAGIGKSALVERFISGLGGEAHYVARGTCVDSYGSSEPYLPILTALAGLCRGAFGDRVVEILERVAPAWALQLPELFTREAREDAARRSVDVSSPRLVRELTVAVELIARQAPLVWCFEDLHWADRSTLELLAHLARRADLGSMLLIGSYRPPERRDSWSLLACLAADLDLRGACRHLALEPLALGDVVNYLAKRFPGHRFSPTFAMLVHERTAGTPLFVAQWLDGLLDRALLQQAPEGWTLTAPVSELGAHLPDTTVQTIEAQLDRLERRERDVLDAACVAGATFAVTAVANVLGEDVVALERQCLNWARQRRLLRIVGEAEWPDGTRSSLFGFAHALYQEVLYRRLGAVSRAELHKKLGTQLENAYGARAPEVARELALHFERGSDAARAAQYLHLAAKTAIERCAHSAAIEQLRRGLAHLTGVPDGTRRHCIELDLQATLGSVLSTVLGHGAPEVHAAYQRVRELSELLGSGPLHALFGAWMSVFMRGNYAEADELALQIAVRAGLHQDERLAAGSSVMLGLSSIYLGNLSEARRRLEAGLRVLELEARSADTLASVLDPRSVAYNLSWALWLSGYPDSALVLVERGLASTHAVENPHGWAYLMHFASVVHELRGEHVAALARVEAMQPLCERQELGFFAPLTRFAEGCQHVQAGDLERGVQELQEGIAAMRGIGIGVAVSRPYAILTEALTLADRLDEALVALRTGFEFVVEKRERWWEPELHRLHGELWWKLRSHGKGAEGCDLGTSNARDPEGCVRHALDTARARGALSLELRAAMSLARLWRNTPRHEEGRQILLDVTDRFTEGGETADRRAARTLLLSLQK